MSLKRGIHNTIGCCPQCNSDELDYNDLIYISNDMVVFEYTCSICSHDGTLTYCLCKID